MKINKLIKILLKIDKNYKVKHSRMITNGYSSNKNHTLSFIILLLIFNIFNCESC